MRTGIPQETRKIPNLNGFLIENLRGPAIKLGCVVVSGHTPQLPIITSRIKRVRLVAQRFHSTSMFAGSSFKKPPKLPDNVTHYATSQVTDPVGSLIVFHDSGIDCDTIEFVKGARVMGPVELVKPFLKGRKFYVLNRHKDFICMELA